MTILKGVMMKKILCLVMCVFLVIGLSACGGDSGGDISKVKTHDVDSIEKEFDANWNGCTLTEIYYAGDDYCTDFQEFADRNNADEVIVLLSSFDVDSSGGDGSLNPNSTYNNWNWILVRTKGGKWQHIDHGY